MPFRNRKPVGPIRRKLLYEDSDDDSEADNVHKDIKDNNTKDKDNKSRKDIHDMVENYKQSVQSKKTHRKMVKNYVDAYVDISDEEMDEILEQHNL